MEDGTTVEVEESVGVLHRAILLRAQHLSYMITKYDERLHLARWHIEQSEHIPVAWELSGKTPLLPRILYRPPMTRANLFAV